VNDAVDGSDPHRSEPVQLGPPADLSAFPSRSVLAGTVLYRQHELRAQDADAGCWYFDGHAPGSPVEGRFSLTSPRGTCYLAETAEVAARERVGRHLAQGLPIPLSFVEDRVVTRVPLPADGLPAADACDPDASTSHRVTRELFTGHDYELTGAWGDALDSAGFGSLIYEPRFSTGPGFALALFGTQGSQSHRLTGSGDPLRGLLSAMGILVTGVPSSLDVLVDDNAPC
jgi:hypothetical protein